MTKRMGEWKNGRNKAVKLRQNSVFPIAVGTVVKKISKANHKTINTEPLTRNDKHETKNKKHSPI